MFFCEKKIIYLTVYEYGERTASAGFAVILGEKDRLRLKLQVKNAGEGVFPINLTTKQLELKIGTLKTRAGTGSYETSFHCDGEKAVVEGKEVWLEEICGVKVELQENKYIGGEWRRNKAVAERAVKEQPQVKEMQIQEPRAEMPQEKKPCAEEPQVKEPRAEEPQMKAAVLPEREIRAVSLPTDKWEQLKTQYKTVHPFGDEREFISIELKDFIILRDSCQKLIHNSFLLHGFYNYQHLILGKDCQLGKEGETCFYLGVPGVFFEREKMVAVMFGFEGFESAGAVEAGKFGYYLRRVEI